MHWFFIFLVFLPDWSTCNFIVFSIKNKQLTNHIKMSNFYLIHRPVIGLNEIAISFTFADFCCIQNLVHFFLRVFIAKKWIWRRVFSKSTFLYDLFNHTLSSHSVPCRALQNSNKQKPISSKYFLIIIYCFGFFFRLGFLSYHIALFVYSTKNV